MKKTYKVIRKYPTEQFGNMDFEAKGLESRDDIAKELEHFDKIAEEYKNKPKKCCPDFPSCSCSQPIKVGDTPAKKPRPF